MYGFCKTASEEGFVAQTRLSGNKDYNLFIVSLLGR